MLATSLEIGSNAVELPLSISVGDTTIASVLDPPFMPVYPDAYPGPYEVTPSSEAQVLPTAHCTMTGDLVVEPIPSNYGLITWNGSTLTVS